MNYRLSVETFFVKELFSPKLSDRGAYCYYIIEKKGLSHSLIEKKLRALGCSPSFSGIKDKNASTTQWFSSLERIDNIRENNFSVKFAGMGAERLFVGAHKSNEFSVEVSVEEEEFEKLKKFRFKREFVCNYFGEQRFSSKNLEIIGLLKANNFEDALKVLLTKKTRLDSEKSAEIKEFTAKNWGKWEVIANHGLIKGTNKEALFKFLTENPKEFLRAFRFAEPKSVRILIKAWQAKRFNEELKKLAQKKVSNPVFVEINGNEFPVNANKSFPRNITIEPTQVENEMGSKSKLERKTFFAAEKFKVKKGPDGKTLLVFVLRKGAYATVFLKFISIWVTGKVNKH